MFAGWEGRQDADVNVERVVACDGLDKTLVNRD
jgi:hypothetical protein